jgi:cysteine desulfurase
VLLAMGALTSGNIRISLHAGVGQQDVERFLATLPEAVAAVRSQAPGSPAARSSAEHSAGSPGAAEAVGATGGATEAVQAGPVVDSRGRRCPLPVLDLARALPGVRTGSELTVLADDPAAASDLAAWCRMRGQQLVSQASIGQGATAYLVRRLR